MLALSSIGLVARRRNRFNSAVDSRSAPIGETTFRNPVLVAPLLELVRLIDGKALPSHSGRTLSLGSGVGALDRHFSGDAA